jgi:dual specificity tyrosine-phosphorylation-regulated kinase 2/3/4
MSAQEAFKVLQPLLWDYEKTEILEFENVYFFNIVERKKQSSEQRRTQASGGSTSTMLIMGSDNPKLINYGFDNENQEYNVVMHEHLAYRYEVVKKLGKGSFGIVLRVFDHKTKEFVALKILKNKKRLYKQGLVEARLIENLNKADPEDKKNIIRKLD